MVGMISYWDVHEELVQTVGGSKRWLSMYLFSLEAFGGTDMFLVGQPDIVHGYNIQHQEFANLTDILTSYPDAKIVACVGSHPPEIAHVDLGDYVHPAEDVIYLVGGDYGDIEFDKLTGRDVDYIHVDNAIGTPNLWSAVITGIVLRDRYLKSL